MVSLSADTRAFASCHTKYSSVSVYISDMKKICTEVVSRSLGSRLVQPMFAAGLLAAVVFPASWAAAAGFTNEPSIGTGALFPQGLAPAATGKQTLYAAAQTAAGRSHLLVLNTQFGTITANITLINFNTLAFERGATQVALNPAGTLAFVVNFTSNSVDIVDLATNSELGTLQAPKIGPNPVGVRVSPNGKQLWVANTANNPPALNNGTVSVIDLTTAGFPSLAQINTGGSPNTVKFNSKGSVAYILNGNLNGFVDEVNVRKFTIMRNSIGTPNLNNPDFLAMDITKDNSTLYIGNSSSFVNNVDIPTGDIDNSIFMFPGIGIGLQDIGQVAVSPDQKWVVCADLDIASVSVANQKTQVFNTFLSTFAGSEPYFLAFSDDSKTLYISESFFGAGLNFIAVYSGF
jgi:DNA-binding beta-propeller fold protein YncE